VQPRQPSPNHPWIQQESDITGIIEWSLPPVAPVDNRSDLPAPLPSGQPLQPSHPVPGAPTTGLSTEIATKTWLSGRLADAATGTKLEDRHSVGFTLVSVRIQAIRSSSPHLGPTPTLSEIPEPLMTKAEVAELLRVAPGTMGLPSHLIRSSFRSLIPPARSARLSGLSRSGDSWFATRNALHGHECGGRPSASHNRR
jgi:hypothetical protein